jgi:amino acid adenylation domain-containing protein
MTALKFIPNPFSDDPSSKLYRTGDLVRYREDGNIEFLGRIDTQVKIRGYRIELGEIEAILQMHPAIRQNAVVVWDDNTGDKFMVAYLEPEEGKGIEIRDVRNFLADKLPGYMIPSSFVIMDILPLLPNGKVDRKALQPPEGGRSHSEAKYVPPRSPVESMLTEIWEQVLGIKRVGVYDNFFELGGHSLLATKVISRIRNVMKVEVPIRDLFENPTVASLSNRVEIVLKKDSGLEMPPLEPLPRNPDTGIPDGDLLPSFSQQRLWFLDQLAPGNLFYNLPMAVKLEGNLDVSALEYSLNEIVRRHASLRTTFKAKDGKPIQAITPEWVIELPVDDLTSMTNEEREQSVSQAIMSEAQRPFNLETGPLMRVRLLKLNNKNDEKQEAYVFVLVMHHIISDGWSMGVFINELAALYSAYTANMSIKLPELRIQYYDFAAWQQEWLQGDVLEKQLDYWRKQLANQPKLLSLPTDHPRPPIQTSRGDIEKFNLPADLSEKVKQLSRKENVTLFMFLLAVYQILLSRYSGQDDISVGTAIAGRNMTDTEALIGFFVNTLVMRTDLSGQPNFREVLKRVREVTLGAFAHQDMPFEILVEQLQPERDLSHTPLFQVAFALQNIPTDERLKGVTDPTATIFDKSSEENDQSVLLELSDVELKQIDINSGTSKFDITLSMAEGDDGLLGAIEYNLDLFEPETIRRLIGHFRTLIEGIVDNPNLAIDLIPILTQEEKDQILEEWNKTLIETPINQCAHQRFEIHAKKTPHKVAVLLDDESISYGDLNRRANQLAHFLINLGVKREDLIGISTKRSLEMVVGILGVMKAGCAYLPIDPTYPPDRIAFMIQDSGISVLLTQGKIVEHLPLDKIDNVPELVLLDDQWESDLAIQPDTTPDVTVLPENLAYVIYTSGSTGLPKGTMLRHNGLCNLAEAQRLAFHIDENSRILQFAPLSFDASVWETFMALANGATLCLARQEVLSSGIEMARYMQEKSITNVTLPPSVLRVLPNEELSNLETVIAAGEACTPELVQQWAHGRDFFNAYGPTETTVCASMHLCSVDEKDAPPIGKPIANTKLYILDENMLPCPVGVPGELHVSGVSVARGYLRRPAMTAQKFVPNPFSNVPGDRLYKTGDLVRYRDNGDIEFLGRIDHQVKVRGFRIELGEIEAALNEYSGIKEGVVLAYEVKPNETRLVAYLVSSEVSVGQNKQELDIGAVKSFLRKLLPDYMIPSYFIILDEMPYSPSGKVDKKQLPPPGKDRSSLRNVYVAPSNDIERELVEISAELLGVERVGVNDNFFELGGHSLLATQFISRVRESLEVELELRQLFETPTVAEIAKVIENTRSQITDDRSRISELIQRINELSDEEVAELLELKRKSKKIQESN